MTQHHKLETHLVTWPRLKDILAGVLLEIEQDLWTDRFENLEEPGDEDDRDPTVRDSPNTSLEDALRTAPGLRTLLDQAMAAFDLPDYVGNELERAYNTQVERVRRELEPRDTTALRELAEAAMRGGAGTSEENNHPEADPDHVLQATTTRDIQDLYDTGREGDGARVPEWAELTDALKAALVRLCQELLDRDPQAGPDQLQETIMENWEEDP